MKEYFHRYNELNDYLSYFNENGVANMLPEDEVKDHLEFAIPSKWRQQMTLQGFDPTTKTTQEMIEFCERLECFEEAYQHPASANAAKTGKGKSKIGESTNLVNKKRKRENKFYCHYHGPNTSHNTGECKVVLAQAENMHKANNNHFNKFNNKNDNKNYKNFKPRGLHVNTKAEFQAYVERMVKNAQEKVSRKRKKSEEQTEDGTDNFNYEEFCKLNVLSDLSESNHNSHVDDQVSQAKLSSG